MSALSVVVHALTRVTRVTRATRVIVIRFVVIVGVLGLGVVVSACTGSGDQAGGVAPDSSLVAATGTAVPIPTPTPSPTPDPRLSAAQIHRELSPSVASITNPAGSAGSGVLIDQGYILTNLHVVSLYPTVDVTFSDGTDLAAVPVAAVDLHRDLALVGPVDVAVPPVALAAVDGPDIGEVVYLIGYPDEWQADPTAAITKGIVSRRRQPLVYEHGFIQVDAAIAPGQSGGALVDEEGTLVGISGLRFGEASFGLVLDSIAVAASVDMMLAEPTLVGRTALTSPATLSSTEGESITVLLESSTGEIDAAVTTDIDVTFEITTTEGGIPVLLGGDPIDYFGAATSTAGTHFVDAVITGTEQLDVLVDPGVYMLTINPIANDDLEAELFASGALFAMDDETEGQSVSLGETHLGAFESLTDRDRWTLLLDRGQQVQIEVESISDMVAVLRRDGEVVASGDDDAGIFGSSPSFSYTADEAGEYELVVGQLTYQVNGYALRVRELSEDQG